MNKLRALVRWLRRMAAGLKRASTVLRWLAAGGLGVWTVRQAILVGREQVDKAFAVIHSLDAFAGLLVTVLLVAPEVAQWAITPLNRMIDVVLLPSDSEPPPADYTLARMYQQQLRYDEACDEYLKIIRYHPEELSAYLEGIVTAGKARQIELAARFYRLGRRAFRREEARRRLQRTLEESCSAALLADEAADATEAAADDASCEKDNVPPQAIDTPVPE